MKNAIVLFIAALCVTASAKAQSTADSIHAKYQMQPMPEALTIEKTFPVLGTYQLTTDGTSQNVTVSLDSTNKGVVWISGLPEGTMKAYLKKSPGIYRIVSQKSESGKQIPEGTLFFDPATNSLSVALGKAYNEADPTAVFSDVAPNSDLAANGGTGVKVKTKTLTSKTKSRLVFYTATKAETSNSTSTNAAKQ